ncbi:MAG: HEAT repeat domain-containing protein [Kofleriaceae bacterium]
MRQASWLAFGLAMAGMTIATPVIGQPAPKKPKPGRGAKAPKTVDISGHVSALAGTDLEAAARAAEALAAIDAPAAHDALLDGLALGLPPAVAVSAMTGLGAHPAPPDVGLLKRYAGHHSPSVRSAAISALALYPDPVAHASVIGGLRDQLLSVRSAAAAAAGRARIRSSVEPLMQLLARGEESAAKALGELATPELARQIADQLGKVPDPALALCLGTALKRNDFGPDQARVEVVRTIAKIQDASAITALTEYIDATPQNPPRASRQEAVTVVEARIGGK